MKGAIVMETIQRGLMTLKEAKDLLSIGVTPIDMATLSQGYSYLIEEAIKDKKFTFEYKKTLAAAYRKLAEGVCEFQIEKDGEFKTRVDFSSLNGIVVFPNQTITGVNICKACSGIGERIKFHKKPIKVQCLKCKSQAYILNGEEIIVDDELILVNGENKTVEPKYNRLIGRVVEDCLSCGGTGRYITDLEPDLRINVICKTCNRIIYHPDSEKTQVLIKCKTCKGKRTVKIPVLSPEVNTTTLCRVCSGMGFVRPKPGPDNPVLTKDLGSIIKSSVV